MEIKKDIEHLEDCVYRALLALNQTDPESKEKEFYSVMDEMGKAGYDTKMVEYFSSFYAINYGDYFG